MKHFNEYGAAINEFDEVFNFKELKQLFYDPEIEIAEIHAIASYLVLTIMNYASEAILRRASKMRRERRNDGH